MERKEPHSPSPDPSPKVRSLYYRRIGNSVEPIDADAAYEGETVFSVRIIETRRQDLPFTPAEKPGPIEHTPAKVYRPRR